MSEHQDSYRQTSEPDETAEVLPFRRRPEQESADRGTVSGPSPDEATPVNPSETTIGEDRDVPAVLRARFEGARPVLPSWLKNRDEAKEAAKWAVRSIAHRVGYHVVRLPIYAGRLVLRAPIGLGRLSSRFMAWWWDTEGDTARLATVTPKPDPETYLKLARHHDARKRGRSLLLVFVAIPAIVAALVGGAIAWRTYAAPSMPEWAAASAGWAALAGVVLLLGYAGRRADQPIASSAVVPTHVERLTDRLVLRALGAIGHPEINRAVSKGTNEITFPAPIVRDGPGWRAEVDLPYGVTAGDVVERRDRLASGLRRPLGCVWPEPSNEEHTGRLVLWVGDRDLSKVSPPAWPLAKSGRADIFKELPFGFDQRQRQIGIQLMFASMLIGAMPRQGKTFALRVLLLAAALDPRVQLRVFELKGTGDLNPLEKVAHHYASGADDETIERLMSSLRELAGELARRAKVIAGLPKDLCPENKVTSDLAGKKSLGLSPIVFAIDEVQELFTHPQYAKEAAELCLRIIKLGPAMGIMLVLATQRPDKDSLPTGISANIGIRFCLRVMGQVENDMVLGTSAFKNGIRATMLTSKDKGIGYLVGAHDEPNIVRTAFVDAPTADRIADRARAARLIEGTLTGHAAGEETGTEESSRNLLADLTVVFGTGEDKLWSETIVDRLRELRPAVYGEWTKEHLATAIDPYGIRTRQIWGSDPETDAKVNRRGLRLEDIRKVLTDREDTKDGAA